MAAITAAEQGVRKVLMLEGTPEPLQKVRISGGGRCNVTHACWDPRELATHYPRGGRPLRGPFSRFACGDAIAWFCLLYTSPSPRDVEESRMPSSA